MEDPITIIDKIQKYLKESYQGLGDTMIGGVSTALQNQNIDQFGNNRLSNFKNFMSNNAVNQITKEEANQFSNQVIQQQPMIPQQFNAGGFNQQNPLMVNAAALRS